MKKKKIKHHSSLPVLLVALAIIILLWLVFSKVSFAPGKAIAGNQGATIELTRSGNTLLLSANIGSLETNGFYVELNSAEFDVCSGTTFQNKLNWNEGYETQSCMGIIKFGDAALNPPVYKTGSFEIVSFTFPFLPDSFNVVLNPLSIYETTNGDDLFTDAVTFSFSGMTSTVSYAPPSGGSSSGGGGGGGGTPSAKPVTAVLCIENWSCGSWSTCDKGKELRVCADKNACRTVKTKPAEERACDTKMNDVPAEAEEISVTAVPQLQAASSSSFRKVGIVASIVSVIGLATAGLLYWRRRGH